MTITLRTSDLAAIAILALTLLAAWWAGEGGLPNVLPSKIDRATYVYEKDQGSVPPAIAQILKETNQEGEVVATAFEQHTVDASGNTPPQFRTTLSAAKEAGLPSLVLQAGDKVVKVIEKPTAEQVREVLE